MKLQYKLALLLFAFGNVFLIAIFSIFYFYTRSNTLKDSHASLLATAEKNAKHVEIHLKEKVKMSIAHLNDSAIIQALTLSNSEFATFSEVEREQQITRLNKRWTETEDIFS